MSPDIQAMLREERSRRGLPDYARPAPKPKPVVVALAEESWHRCARCGEDYPQSAFQYGGNANPKQRVCNACWAERYTRVQGKCSVCGGRVDSWRQPGKGAATFVHRKCAHTLPVTQTQAYPCLTCGHKIKWSRSAAAPARGWSVHRHCLADLPAEYVGKLTKAETSQRNADLTKRKRAA